MNPFEQLVRHATRPVSTPVCSAPEKRQGSTGRIFALLERHGALSTSALATKAGLNDSRLVWGLMKHPRSSGRVQFQNGMWSLSQAFHESRLKQAAELLRQHGWVCTPPQGC